MWPLNKKRKNKGITIAPGESVELKILTAWRKDKNEVAIITDNGPIILDGKNELFVKISADNIDPIKLKVVPDFKNRVLNFVEVVDPNAKNVTGNRPKFTISGSNIVREDNISFDEYLERYDKNIEDYGKSLKRYRHARNIFIPICIVLIVSNTYFFIIKNGMSRYINLFSAIVAGYMIYYIYNYYRKFYKDYKEYKELREKIFGVVKET